MLKCYMKRLFKKGELVRSTTDGNVVEILRYVKSDCILVKSFDTVRKEVYVNQIKASTLSKAA